MECGYINNFNDFCSVFRRRADAVAFINGSPDYPKIKGRVLFYQLKNAVIVRADIWDLPKGRANCESLVFAFHIHKGEKCSGNKNDPFADANGHFNPDNCPHPYHAGDLPPLFSVNGKAFSVFLTDRFTVKEIMGRAIIIHSRPDDFMTQPAGNSGEKIACGIITPTARIRG